MLITAYPDMVRREGLAVEVVNGFASRSHGEFQRNPPAIVWHHDASPAGPSPGVLGWMIDNWDNASANAWVDYNGTWWFVGAGVAWHAGATLPGMPNNQTSIGIETDYTVGETISWNLYDSLRRGTAAIMRATGQPASDLHFHKTICSPVGRKSDPWALDLAVERAAVAKLIAGGNSPLPLPDPNAPGGPGGADPREWDEMATQAELEAVIKRLIPSPEAYARAVWATVLNVFHPVANATDARAGDLLASAENRAQSLPTDDSVSGAVWSKNLDAHRDMGGAPHRAGDMLANVDAATAEPPTP